MWKLTKYYENSTWDSCNFVFRWVCARIDSRQISDPDKHHNCRQLSSCNRDTLEILSQTQLRPWDGMFRGNLRKYFSPKSIRRVPRTSWETNFQKTEAVVAYTLLWFNTGHIFWGVVLLAHLDWKFETEKSHTCSPLQYTFGGFFVAHQASV